MLLFVGLGNPTPNSENNRHNIGFKIIDAINQKFSLSKQKPKFKGLLTTGNINNKKIYAIKPLTFMNNSGTCIRELLEYFKIDAENVIVFHDDFDIDFGKIKVKFGGSSGGHHGVESIDKFSREFNKQVMIICSRNQIECKSLGSGYMNDFSTESFSKYIHNFKKNNKNILLCRDHSGPFTYDTNELNINQEIIKCKESLNADIINLFDKKLLVYFIVTDNNVIMINKMHDARKRFFIGIIERILLNVLKTILSELCFRP